MKNQILHKIIAIVSLFTMLFVLIGGALVTKTGSGLGCGRSWPLCDGQLIPSNITPELIIELSHRLVTGVAIIIVGILAIVAWRHYQHVKETKFLVIMTILFFIIQSLLGAGAVLIEQTSLIKALHFGVSLISFATVFLLTLIIFNIDKHFNTDQINITKTLRTNFYGLFVYTLIVVYSGALVRHKSASLVCLEWPHCNEGQAISTFSVEQWIQMGHRLMAGLLFIWVVGLLIYLFKNYKSNFLKQGWFLATVLITIQVVLGALVIFTLRNVNIALMHALFISLFFALLCYFVLLAYRSNNKNNNEQ
ncbi:COX15/CtaA family protein [Aquisalibacillus elongatus]|uniref:Heme A synthase n=1 Tax=Aquisalibacillus elongatus TaxID=485577 RepID=A0A3N5C965_9BACI|nr:heme A synthase [Aquisalibacillus elongatus]RPF56122.1 cytochrome c oxidase assembly protein subunit 15 [Aquisalibacillus elongatus]